MSPRFSSRIWNTCIMNGTASSSSNHSDTASSSTEGAKGRNDSRRLILALLNAKIKRRVSFRPFAPSVLEEAVSEWFEEDDAVPFMMQVFQIREEKRGLIPAVTHVDGSGRLQTVSRHTNPRYHKLIAAYHDLTEVPM